MEFFVAESQKFLTKKRLHATARNQEKWLFSEATESKTSVKYMYLGYAWGRLDVLELTDNIIFTPLLNKPPTLWYRKPSFSGREVTCIKLHTLLSFLSPLYFVIDCVN